jgi:hypothetical protein
MLAPLFGYLFSMITMLTAVVVVLASFSNISTLKGRHHLRPPEIAPTLTVDRAAQSQSPAAQETSPAKEVSATISMAKADTKKSKRYKPKVVARRYINNGYGNALGYAEETRYGPRGLFFQ